MSQIDMFIVSVAVPEIQSDLHAGFGQMQFVIDGYVIAYAAGMVTGGRLGDRVGRKKVFQWGVAAFTVTSLLCALAPSANTLVAARVLQGLSAALMAPQVLSILRAVFVHDRDRSRAVGAYGASIGSGVIAGLVGGGLLLDLDVAGLGWRMIFLLRLPPARRQVRHPRIDRRSHHHGRESVRRADGDRHGDGPQALYLAGIMGISGFGQGLVVAPLIDTVLARVHPDDAGAGSGVLNTVTQAGMALGVAAIGALYRAFLGASPQEPEHPVRAADFADAFDATSCVLAALAPAAALL
ncbi:MFS transporter [Streptomyces morookaense]|uniref:MFS transporter n=1 Tax=Streptomyces morookaense TaxID=1970 RepID=UPI001E5642A1|nr:MFS transporter [Streptomyces morookaense]